jgi:periplasmic protein TonB
MDYAQQQRNPMRHLVGLTIVVLLHVVVIYALVTGLAHKVVEVLKAPLETKIIEEVKPPPPPEIKLPPPPKLSAPPPPFIPPPEVQIQTPPQVQSPISTTSTAPPTHEYQAAPQTSAQPAPKPKKVTAYCANAQQTANEVGYPVKAQRAGLESGTVTLSMVITPAGDVKDVTVLRSSNRIFSETALSIAARIKCQATGVSVDTPVEWTMEYKLGD